MLDFKRHGGWLTAARDWAIANVQYQQAKAKRKDAKAVFFAAFERRDALPEPGSNIEGFGGGVKVMVVHYHGRWNYDIKRLMERYPELPWDHYKTRTKSYYHIKPTVLETVPVEIETAVEHKQVA